MAQVNTGRAVVGGRPGAPQTGAEALYRGNQQLGEHAPAQQCRQRDAEVNVPVPDAVGDQPGDVARLLLAQRTPAPEFWLQAAYVEDNVQHQNIQQPRRDARAGLVPETQREEELRGNRGGQCDNRRQKRNRPGDTRTGQAAKERRNRRPGVIPCR